MVSEENRTGLYVTIPVYFCLLGASTFWAYRRMETMKHAGTSDKVHSVVHGHLNVCEEEVMSL